MNPTIETEKTIADADPFAADIFASETRIADDEFETDETPDESEKPILWSDQLPQVPRAVARWDELWRRLPPIFFGEMTNRLGAALNRFLDSSGDKTIEFLFVGKRESTVVEKNRTPEDLWWLTVGVNAATTATTDETEIAFAFEDVFAARLIDAALSDSENSPEAVWRALTPTEIAVLEFFALNLIFEANRALEAPQFRLRRLSRQLPAALQPHADEPENSSLLALEYQTAGTLLAPSVVRIYLAPEALQALQTNKSGDNFRVRHSEIFPVKTIKTRLFCGGVQLTFGELAALETGDVLLLENQNLSAPNGNLTGRAEIFFGDADNRKLNGNLFSSNRGASETIEESGAQIDNKIPVRLINFNLSVKFAIENFAATPVSGFDNFMTETNDALTNNFPAGEPADESATDDEQNGLAVENLAVALRVELEARRLTLAEVGSLRENQTLELGIRPTDEVNILIDDRIVGRGELVAIEDRLGVRITKLMR